MSLMRSIFGPSKEELWKQLSLETGADYIDGGFWKGSKVEAVHGEWTITLDTFVVSTGKTTIIFTRMRTPYVNPDGFRFHIYHRGFFSELGKFLGMQDITVGYEQFDHDFIIKGTDEQKLRSFFSSARLRELIEAQKTISFSVKDDEGCFAAKFPEGVDELEFHVVGVIKDVERLKLLFELFAETLDELCRIGSAYEQTPNVKL